MLNRRDIVAHGAAAAAVLAGAGAAFARPERARLARLETRLFNFNPDIAKTQVLGAVSRLKTRAARAGLDGFIVGQNAISEQFPTRFEGIYMAQWDPAAPRLTEAAGLQFRRAQAELASLCRDEAICDLICPLPDGYANAPGVKVRHTVMFSFRPDASPADRLRNVEAIRGMGKLPMVQTYRVEPAMRSASGPDQMGWQVIGDFASVADYKAYSDAPAHLVIREDFQAHTSRVAYLDVVL